MKMALGGIVGISGELLLAKDDKAKMMRIVKQARKPGRYECDRFARGR